MQGTGCNASRRECTMSYYRQKAQIESLLQECALPSNLRGFFRVVKELYAHARYDLALSLCSALVLSRCPPEQDQGLSADVNRRFQTPQGQAGQGLALEAIYTALACALAPSPPNVQESTTGRFNTIPLIWLHIKAWKDDQAG